MKSYRQLRADGGELTIIWWGVFSLVGFPCSVNGPLLTHSHMSSSNLMGYHKRRDDCGRENLVRFGRRKWVGVIIFHCTLINSLSKIKKSVTKTWAYKITSLTMVQPHMLAHWPPSYSSVHPLYLPARSFPHSLYGTHILLFFLPHCQCALMIAVSLFLISSSTTPYVHTGLGFLLIRSTALVFVSVGHFA